MIALALSLALAPAAEAARRHHRAVRQLEPQCIGQRLCEWRVVRGQRILFYTGPIDLGERLQTYAPPSELLELLDISGAAGHAFGIGLCISASLILGTVRARRELRWREAFELFVGCLLPGLGPRLVGPWLARHPEWDILPPNKGPDFSIASQS